MLLLRKALSRGDGKMCESSDVFTQLYCGEMFVRLPCLFPSLYTSRQGMDLLHSQAELLLRLTPRGLYYSCTHTWLVQIR